MSPVRREAVAAALRLTERDRALVEALYWHGCLTTEHIRTLFFRSSRKAQKRLLWLYRQEFVERFYPAVPRTAGKPHAHYVLGEAGAKVVAGLLGVAVRDLHWQRVENLGAPSVYRHQLAVNDLFVALARGALRRKGQALARWASGRECLRLFAERLGTREILPRIRPDGWGLYLHARGAVPFFLELDRGTESGRVLEEKALRYLRHHRERPEEMVTVLFLPPAARRAGTIAEAVGRGIGRQVRAQQIEPGPGLSFWVCEERSGKDPCDWVWKHVPRGAAGRLIDLPAMPAGELRVEDCLGVRWPTWAREMGGLS